MLTATLRPHDWQKHSGKPLSRKSLHILVIFRALKQIDATSGGSYKLVPLLSMREIMMWAAVKRLQAVFYKPDESYLCFSSDVSRASQRAS